MSTGGRETVMGLLVLVGTVAVVVDFIGTRLVMLRLVGSDLVGSVLVGLGVVGIGLLVRVLVV